MANLSGTDRPFTVAVCMRCKTGSEPSLMPLLRNVIQHCPHGVLISAQCMLGELTCVTADPGSGPMVLLQPCSVSRAPTAPAVWIGPVGSDADAVAVCDWVGGGDWNPYRLPGPLRAGVNLMRAASQN